MYSVILEDKDKKPLTDLEHFHLLRKAEEHAVRQSRKYGNNCFAVIVDDTDFHLMAVYRLGKKIPLSKYL